jgi:site-specific DNA-adenine methylase
MGIAYHGGKYYLGKKIARVIYDETCKLEEDEDIEIKGYCEPFCGMLGVFRHIPETFKYDKPKLKYKAGDANRSIISMWKATQKGWVPKSLYNKEEYELLLNTPPSPERGFVGHSYTYRGIEFSGYFKHKLSKRLTHARQVAKIGAEMADNKVVFSAGSYTQYSSLKNYIIYCDPPYSLTEQRYYDDNHNRRSFDNDAFWTWCRKMSEYNVIFVSEYSAPKDFTPLLSKRTRISGTGNRKIKTDRTENLYIL